MNVGKSKLLIFTNQKSKKTGGSKVKNKSGEASTINGCNTDVDDDSEGIELFINGERLKEVDFAKYLGVLIDNKLKWTNHIDAINLKLSKGNGLLAKIRHYVPNSVLRSLFFSFINPHTDYNLLNWSMAPTTKLDTIAKKIKKAVRIISFEDSDSHSIPLFKKQNILPLAYSIKTKHAKFMWQLYNDFLPISLSENFYTNSRTQYSTSESRLASLDKFVLFAGPKVWNDIPTNIKKKSSLNSFSKNLSKHYIQNL